MTRALLDMETSTAENHRGTIKKILTVLLCAATNKPVSPLAKTSVSLVPQMEPCLFDRRVFSLALCPLWDRTRIAPPSGVVECVGDPWGWGSGIGRNHSILEPVVGYASWGATRAN